MKLKTMIFFLFALVFFNSQPVFCQKTSPSGNPSLDTIVDRIEKRYAGPGFTARFDQKSTLKAMDITDTAYGKVFIKRPRLMRWEYESPEKQVILTDGAELWLYKPEDNQVMKGKAPEYFGDGKGASFLSDIRLVRKNFNVTPEKDKGDYHILKLMPKEKKLDIESVYLWISKKTYDIVKVITYNTYGDENLIEMSNFQFRDIDGSVFNFIIPEGTDILRLGE
ncbi:outer membrane lipoprotein carrier protein LolA [Desulfobacterales bacterium HSG2]|nr:outer membrane lipoprotein carrier protein LolA [Desulfobacterales bacterium HSG2]